MGTGATLLIGYGAANVVGKAGGAYTAFTTFNTLNRVQKLAVCYAGYAVAGDVAGVLQSGYGVYNRNFNPLNLGRGEEQRGTQHLC